MKHTQETRAEAAARQLATQAAFKLRVKNETQQLPGGWILRPYQIGNELGDGWMLMPPSRHRRDKTVKVGQGDRIRYCQTVEQAMDRYAQAFEAESLY